MSQILSFSIFFLSIILNILLFPASIYAQSEEEMKVLQMYFREDDLVIAPTRTPKLLSQVAENVSIVTAEDIRAMNAHSIYDVLKMVTGVFIEYQGQDFGTFADVMIQGSLPRHVLFLLDGIPLNTLSDGNVHSNAIPVRMIKRIEIVKGPASSSWGSSLGGVINIVTKDVGEDILPSGSVSASIGERKTQDYSAEAAGKAGSLGYYLYAGRKDSDGLRDDRSVEHNSFYAKLDIPVHAGTNIRLTAGYSEPRLSYGTLPLYDYSAKVTIRQFFTTASFSTEFNDNLTLEASVYRMHQKFVTEGYVLNDTGYWDDYLVDFAAGDMLEKRVYDEKHYGGSAQLVWRDDVNTAVIGIDASDGDLEATRIDNYYQENDISDPGVEKWAVFANDTLTIGNLSVTPGIRYDYNNINGDFTSPSLGATYQLKENTVLRASAAKGFTAPPLLWISQGTLFFDPNPSLKPEKVWSYQAGAESWISDYLHARAVIFHHTINDEMVDDINTATDNTIVRNKGEVKRSGFELDAETSPFHNISLKTGYAFVRKKLVNEDLYPDIDTAQNIYAINAGIRYNDGESLSALLSGNYVWWDSDYTDTEYDAFIWDFNLSRKIYSSEYLDSEFILTVHNIFNDSHYTFDQRKNPRRWVEAGLRLSF